MANIYIGTSGYSYKHWLGEFYPSTTKTNEMLAYYNNYLNTVEINSTFYRLPFAGMVKGWKNKTRSGFIFSIKASRLITHYKKLLDTKEILSAFITRLSILEEKLGPILYQLPSSFRKDFPLFKKFIEELPKGLKHVIEFREESWLDEEVFNCLKENGIAYCIVSAPKKICKIEAIGSFAYIRMHGISQWYCYNYTENDLVWWKEKIIKFLDKGIDVYIYFNNDARGYAIKNALMLKEIINKDFKIKK